MEEEIERQKDRKTLSISVLSQRMRMTEIWRDIQIDRRGDRKTERQKDFKHFSLESKNEKDRDTLQRWIDRQKRRWKDRKT